MQAHLGVVSSRGGVLASVIQGSPIQLRKKGYDMDYWIGPSPLINVHEGDL